MRRAGAKPDRRRETRCHNGRVTLRIALTAGPVRIPPTYFVVEAAAALGPERARLFTPLAEIGDSMVAPLVHSTLDPTDVELLSPRARARAIRGAGRATQRAIESFDPDLVHQHSATHCLPAVRAARRLDVPLLTTLHGPDVFAWGVPVRDRSAWATRRNLVAAAAHSARLLAVSEFLASRARELGWPADKIQLHYQGVDTDYFRPLPEGTSEPHVAPFPPLAPGELPRVVVVGQITPNKGIDDVIRASVAALHAAPHELHFLGSGPLAGRVRSAAREHPHISLDGPRRRSEVRAALREADVLVLAARTVGGRQEAGGGLAALEAQACGTPVIANRCGGNAEMVREGESGVLVDEGDVDALSRALVRILSLTPEERTAMGQRGRRFVVEHRSLQASLADLQRIWQDVTR